MSGSSDFTTCPNCLDDDMHRSEEDGWYRYVECIECGFYSAVETGQMTRQEINEERHNRFIEPLGKDEDTQPLAEELKMGRRYWEYAAHHLTYQDVLKLREDKGLEPWTDIQAREFLSKVGEEIKETVSVAYEEALDMMIDREDNE